MEDSNRRARAEARKKRAILHKARLGSTEMDLTPVVGAEAISLVTALTRESWSLAGFETPSYARRAIPCRVVAGRLT